MSSNDSKTVSSRPGLSRPPRQEQQVSGRSLNEREQLLADIADTLNTTLDLDTILTRVAELVRRVIPFEIFAILLVNERTQDLRMRFHIGHQREVERLRIPLGRGVTGVAAQRRQPYLLDDVRKEPSYISGHPAVKSELAIPLIAKNKVIGVIDLQSRRTSVFKPHHVRLLSAIASRIAVAIENARLYGRLARQAQTLEVLNEISRELTSILNLDELLKRMGESLRRIIDFQMFSVLLLDSAGEKLYHRFSLRFKETVQLKHEIPLGRGLVGSAAAQRQTVIVPDVEKDPRYIKLNPETRSELCVPLVHKDRLIGVLDLEHTRRGYFNEENTRTVSTLAAQIAIAIENARLYERIAAEERRLERDLKMAREVQESLLPPTCPMMRSSEVSAHFMSAQAIGGDIYDFVEYSGGRLAIAVGDVSGKGAPAALFAALVGGIIRSTASLEPSPAEMLSAINVSLTERKIEARFCSMIYAVWDDDRLVMQIANSGQPRPIYCHRGKVERVDTAGLPLGLFDDAEYDEVTIHAHPGDVFVFFSDGIVDAQNPSGAQFGRERIQEVVAKHCEAGAEKLVELLVQAVRKFSGRTPRFDDETVVVLKVKPQAAEVARSDSARTKKRTSGALRNV